MLPSIFLIPPKQSGPDLIWAVGIAQGTVRSADWPTAASQDLRTGAGRRVVCLSVLTCGWIKLAPSWLCMKLNYVLTHPWSMLFFFFFKYYTRLAIGLVCISPADKRSSCVSSDFPTWKDRENFFLVHDSQARNLELNHRLLRFTSVLRLSCKVDLCKSDALADVRSSGRNVINFALAERFLSCQATNIHYSDSWTFGFIFC